MARIPLPDRGQPLDVTYLYQMAAAINDLADSASNVASRYTTVSVRGGGNYTQKISETKIVAGYQDVVSGSVDAGVPISKTYSFGTEFLYPPIVTATVYGTGASNTGNNVTLIVTDVTTSAVTFSLKFSVAGEYNVSVNIIAVGLPPAT